jgi:hypothetical protein
MADIKKIKIGDTTYDIVDAGAARLTDLSEAFETFNLENGENVGSLQQKADGVADGFDFTNKNPNATALDATLTGLITYGSTGNFASAFGGKSSAQGKRSHAEGSTTIAKGPYAHAEGSNSVALGTSSHAEGIQTTAKGDSSHAEGNNTQATGHHSHSEGDQSIASGTASHAEGIDSQAIGIYSHSEGARTQAIGDVSHTEGQDTQATGNSSHAEGYLTKAIGASSHAEGTNTISEGDGSHAEGVATYAKGSGAHAEGNHTQAIGQCSHTSGNYTIANHIYQTIIGQFNENKTDTLFEVGNGSGEDYKDEQGNILIKNRSNAFEVLQDGRVKVYKAPEEAEDVVRKADISALEKLVDGLTDAQITALNNFAKSLVVTEE